MSLFTKRENKEFKKMKLWLRRRYPFCGADMRCAWQRGLISVVLPVYNCEKYIIEAIDAVLTQTYTDLELIIVDDGSTDSSGAIADSYLQKDERVRVIHQKNMKLPTALNNGFAAARGEYLTWTSADNRMLPCCLEILASELTHDRFCDMVFGNMRLIDENGELLRGNGWFELPPLSGSVILPDSTLKLNTHANNTIGAAFLYRAGAAAVLGGYSENKYMLEDYDYFMRMNSLLSIRHILYKKPIYEYRMHSESLTARDEELGITASRPALMDLDAVRRSFYTKNIYFYADGSGDFAAALSAMAKRVLSAEDADKLAAESPPQIFYVNFGNTEPTWTPPRGIPRFVVLPEPSDSIFGYDVMLCANSAEVTGSGGWLCPTDASAAAAFIVLRAKNDIMLAFDK